MEGAIAVPDDFDPMGADEIESSTRLQLRLLIDTHLLLCAPGNPPGYRRWRVA